MSEKPTWVSEGQLREAAREAARAANPVVSVAEYEYRRDLDQYRQREKARQAAQKKRWPAFKKTKKKTQVAAVRGQRRTPPNRRWPTIAQDPLTPARVLTTGPDRCIRSNGTRLQCGRQTECDLD